MTHIQNRYKFIIQGRWVHLYSGHREEGRSLLVVILAAKHTGCWNMKRISISGNWMGNTGGIPGREKGKVSGAGKEGVYFSLVTYIFCA